ncbi:MAG: tetratricopeptide repeat protein [Erysipelotrichaceae bacterium]|nr:tetratricopeptide repeat protein [Erysipelotrichaceae bacterium]
MSSDRILKPEDYLEPECVICDKPVGTKQKIQRIPQGRISQRLDELMGKGEYGQAENLLKYWVAEAKANGDQQGEFMVYNEMMGYYRKMGLKEQAYEAINKALELLPTLEYEHTVSGATCYTNAATVYTAFNEPEKALELFRMAEEIYLANMQNNEYKYASLCNNMALAMVQLKQFDEADRSYRRSLEVLQQCPQSELEKAMAWLNIADAIIAKKGVSEESENEIVEYLYNAQLCLDDDSVERDSYYAFVRDKCYPIYEYFQWYSYAEELKERIREINERA